MMGTPDYFYQDKPSDGIQINPGVQLKLPGCCCNTYWFGQRVPDEWPDGAYVGTEGVVVIEFGKVKAVITDVFDKRGLPMRSQAQKDMEISALKAKADLLEVANIKLEVENVQLLQRVPNSWTATHHERHAEMGDQ